MCITNRGRDGERMGDMTTTPRIPEPATEVLFDVTAALAEFHEAAYNEPFGTGSVERSALRIKLHNQEHAELIDALVDQNIAEIAHELADVVYVAFGTAHSLGIPLVRVVEEIHRANMSKTTDGAMMKSPDGKVIKGPGYAAPNVERVLCGCPGEPCPDGPQPDCLIHGLNAATIQWLYANGLCAVASAQEAVETVNHRAAEADRVRYRTAHRGTNYAVQANAPYSLTEKDHAEY